MLTLVAMKIRPIFAIFAITAILADFAVRAEVGSADSKSTTRFCQDDKSREKYCQSANPDDIERCLRLVFLFLPILGSDELWSFKSGDAKFNRVLHKSEVFQRRL